MCNCQRSARSQSDMLSPASRKPCPGSSGTTTEKPSSKSICAIARIKNGESLSPCTSTATRSLCLLCIMKGAFPSFRNTLLHTPYLFKDVSRQGCVCPHSASYKRLNSSFTSLPTAIVDEKNNE